MRKLLLWGMILTLFYSCDKKKDHTVTPIVHTNTPLATVIKLIAAESLNDLKEAKKYQNIYKIYGKHTKGGDSATVEAEWKKLVTFLFNLGNDKKFTNQMRYFVYDISETIDGNNAEVRFKDKDSTADLKAIVYKLNLDDSSWIVNDIVYIRKK